MHRITIEPARDLDGTALGTTFTNRAARIDARIDGSFFVEACPLMERSDLLALRTLIDRVLQGERSTGAAVLRQG